MGCFGTIGDKPLHAIKLTVKEFFEKLGNSITFPARINISERRLANYVKVMITELGNPDVALLAEHEGTYTPIARTHWLLAAQAILEDHPEFADKVYVNAVAFTGLDNEALTRLVALANEGEGALDPTRRDSIATLFAFGVVRPYLINCVVKSLPIDELRSFISDVLNLEVRSEVTRRIVGEIATYASVVDPTTDENEVLKYVWAFFQREDNRKLIASIRPEAIAIIEEEMKKQESGNGVGEVQEEAVSGEHEEEATEEVIEEEEEEEEEETEGEDTVPEPQTQPQSQPQPRPQPPPAPAQPVSAQPVTALEILPINTSVDGDKILIRDRVVADSILTMGKLIKPLPWGKAIQPEMLVAGLVNVLRPLPRVLEYAVSYGSPRSAEISAVCRDAITALTTIALDKSPMSVMAHLASSSALRKLEECITLYYRVSGR